MTWALMEILRSRGIPTGFFKPFVTRPVLQNGAFVDKDALLMTEYYHLPDVPGALCPIVPTEVPGDEVAREEHLETIDDCFQAVAGENEAVVIMGSDKIFYDVDSPCIADTILATKLDASVLLIDKFQSESMTIYSVLAIESLLKGRLKCIIINKIPSDYFESVQRKLGSVFSKRALPPVLFLPEDRILASSSVRHIVKAIKGDVLAAEDRLGNLVESTSISSAHLKGSLNIFRRIYNKIILLGLDLHTMSAPLAAPLVTGIILTGGRKPAPLVVNTCKDLKIPLIVSPADTFITMEKIQKQDFHIDHQEHYKLKRFLQLLGGESAMKVVFDQFIQS